jgi:hypothetical protein
MERVGLNGGMMGFLPFSKQQQQQQWQQWQQQHQAAGTDPKPKPSRINGRPHHPQHNAKAQHKHPPKKQKQTQVTQRARVRLDLRDLLPSLRQYLSAASLVFARTWGKILAYAYCARQAALLGVGVVWVLG